MSGKRYWMALMLAGFSALSMAQTGGSCQGLVGGAMAQCMQGMGTGSGPGIPGSQASRPVDPVPAGSGHSDADAGGVGNRIRSFFSGWSLDLGGSSTSSNADNSLNCHGLVGGAMSQCLQGVAPASAPIAGAGSSKDSRAAAGSNGATASSSGSVVRNFSIGGGSLNCQGLVGGAMARCLQGM